MKKKTGGKVVAGKSVKNNGKSRKEMIEVSKNGTVAVTHGGMSFLSRGSALPNSNCSNFPGCGCQQKCKSIDGLGLQMETDIMALSHIQPEDLYLVREFVKFMVFQVVVDRWLEKHGILSEKNDETQFQPVFKQYFILANSAQRLADRLGLSPLSRKQLKDTGKIKDLALAIAELQGNKNERIK